MVILTSYETNGIGEQMRTSHTLHIRWSCRIRVVGRAWRKIVWRLYGGVERLCVPQIRRIGLGVVIPVGTSELLG